jgi:ribosomal-protein-alanine N-acetyltransferase
MVELKGERIVLRGLVEEDAEEFARVANNKKIARNMGEGFCYPYTLEDAKDWIKVANEGKKKDKSFVIIFEGDIVGGVNFTLKEGIRSGDTAGGYWIGEEFWGKGIATEAWSLVRDYAFENFDIRRFSAGSYSWNKASHRVLEKCGMKKEGVIRDAIIRFGEVCDDVRFGITRSEWEGLKK